LSLIINCNDQISTKQASLSSISKEIYQVENTISNAVVVAAIDGTVNVFNQINVGDTLQSGVQVCSIVPNNLNQFKVLLYIGTKDIADININQQVKIRLSSLPYNEYGEIKGVITNISTDSRTDNNGNIYYVAECLISDTKIKSKDGDIKNVTVGMKGEIHVITKQRKIIYWLLEKMNLVN